jgi:hypothetical protein
MDEGGSVSACSIGERRFRVAQGIRSIEQGMTADSGGQPVSTLLVDECFATTDDQFVDRVRDVAAPQYLAGLADRWKKDPRPWARQQILKYLALPMDRPGHHPLVKRLFKQAEANGDDELMAAFMVAFDRLVRRKRRMRYHWDFSTRQSSQVEELFAPRNQIMPAKGRGAGRVAVNPFAGQRIQVPARPGRRVAGILFSYTTRGYLRRRAWRYFRRMGFQRSADYPARVAAALASYVDDDVAKGENILDNWSLVHIAFRRSNVLVFGRRKVELAEGQSLGGLIAAPQFEEIWAKPESAVVLLDLMRQASSRLVRVWAMQLLKRHHTASLQALSAEQLLELLDHDDADVQQFAAGLLDALDTVDSWPIATWLRLLETRNMAALGIICQAMERRVRPERLDLAQCVALACARATPVARLGLTWLAGRTVSIERDRATLTGLAQARCTAIGASIAKLALGALGNPQAYQTEDVVQFFDSLNEEVRRGAWDWLAPGSAGYDDAGLWSRLLETPYDDVRLRLIDELDKRSRKSAAPAAPSALAHQDLDAIWATVLLGVHRGGRAKLKALRQISQAIAERPERAERLLPVLVVAIRSVRPPEARTGLSAILAAVAARPEIEAMLAERLPELRLTPTEAKA